MIYILFFLLSSALTHCMELSKPVATSKELRLLEAVADGFVDKPLTLPANLSLVYDNPRLMFGCLKSGLLSEQEVQNIRMMCQAMAEKGDPDALCNLGYCYEYIDNPAQLDLAEKYYSLASDKGLARADYYLGLLYGKQKNEDKSMSHYRRAADRDYEPAQIVFAHYCLDKDEKLARLYFEKSRAVHEQIFNLYSALLPMSSQERLMRRMVPTGEDFSELDVLKIPYIYEKAVVVPEFALLFTKANGVRLDDMIFSRNMLEAHLKKNDSDACLNLGIVYYKQWEKEGNLDFYKLAMRYFKRSALRAETASFELGSMYSHYEKDMLLSNAVYEILTNSDEFKLLKNDLMKKGIIEDKAILKQIERIYFMRAARGPHMRAKSLCGSLKNTFDDLLALKAIAYPLHYEEMPQISEVIVQLIRKGSDRPLLIELLQWLYKSSQDSLTLFNEHMVLCKKDKQEVKKLKKGYEKYDGFAKRCESWIREIETLKSKEEKAIKEEEKRRLKFENNQKKRALKEASKKQQPAVFSVVKESSISQEFIVETPKVIETVEHDSPQIGNRSQREEQPEIIPVKKEKIKTRPAVTNKIASLRKRQNRLRGRPF